MRKKKKQSQERSQSRENLNRKGRDKAKNGGGERTRNSSKRGEYASSAGGGRSMNLLESLGSAILCAVRARRKKTVHKPLKKKRGRGQGKSRRCTPDVRSWSGRMREFTEKRGRWPCSEGEKSRGGGECRSAKGKSSKQGGVWPAGEGGRGVKSAFWPGRASFGEGGKSYVCLGGGKGVEEKTSRKMHARSHEDRGKMCVLRFPRKKIATHRNGRELSVR